AKQYNLNIVFSESVTGLVTVRLANVSIQQALDSIITVNGFAYTKKDNVYKVTTPVEAEREGKMTKLYRLNNADAVKLKETLKNVLTAEGTIEADVRSNAIIVTDIPGVINKIEGMLPELDSITPQVLIEARLIETSLTNTEKLGIDWQTTITAIGSKRPTTFPFTDAIKGTGTKMFPKVNVPSALREETEYTYDDAGNIVSSKTTQVPWYDLTPGFPSVSPAAFLFGTLDFTGLQAIFDMLKTRSDTKLIANPRIVTLNNQEASINVGRKVPLPTYTIDATTGQTTVSGWEELNVGVNLKVTPQVNPAGYIKLKLSPKVDEFTGEWVGTELDRRPITSTREASTEVQIKDGQTVVIGGLVKDRTVSIVKKVPILGDIPILGLFFTRKEAGSVENPREQTDLLIFVTATIIKDSNEPLVAWQRHMVTSPPRPFKLETRAVADIIKEAGK
ncbi:MAG: secretin N-terminal domain-containing protein, partial [Candidatus Omnitrophota bacterium]